MKKAPGEFLTLFSLLNISYCTGLIFQKSRYKDMFLHAWKTNKDPTKTFFSYCFYKEITENIHPKVSISKSPQKGLGVFLQEPLGKHSYVGEYTGVVRKGTIKTFFSSYCVAYPTPFSSFRGFVIDAAKNGNFTRFFNHSTHPNIEMKSVLIDGLLRMIFLSKKPLLPGEELLLDYGTIFPRIFLGGK